MVKNEYNDWEKQSGDIEETGGQFDEYWQVIKSRKNVLIYFSLLAVIVGMTWTFMQTPVFEAKGTLMIEPDERNVLMFPDALAFQTGGRDEYLITQVKILKSRTLAKGVLEELKNKKAISPAGGMTSAINDFLGILTVVNIPDSRLVDVSYRSTNPELSALVVNILFNKYIDFNLRIKTESIKLASEFLTTQINELRQTLSQKEQELQDYGKRKELFYLSGEETTVVEKFADLNTAFTEAQIYRVNREAVYCELKDKKFENYAEVSRNPLILDLKKEHSDVEAQYKRKAQIFKDSYPEMQRLLSQLNYLQERIDRESIDIGKKTLQEAEVEYQTAKKKEDALAALLNRQKQDVVATNTSAIYYNSLKIEVTNMRNLLDHLVRKQKESMLSSRLEGLQTSNIKIIDLAEVPISAIFPQKKTTFIFSLLLGICGGIGLIFLLDWLDKTVKTPEEVEKLLKLPALGFIPAIGADHNYYYSYYARGPGKKEGINHEQELKEIELANYLEPESVYAENYRNIRTAILLSTPDHFPRVMTVTSAMPREGKTATAVNLAVSFTHLDKKVLIIDADLREPRLHKIFKIDNTAGLSTILAGKGQADEILLATGIKNLTILPSGPLPPSPSELLNTASMKDLLLKVKEHFDFVFLDSPPLVGIMDPVIIGHQSDAVLLITWGGKTHKKLIEKARDDLNKYANIRLLGVVLNKVDMKRSGYDYYLYNYYNGGYKNDYKEKKTMKKEDG